MLIQCTKKLLDQFKEKPKPATEELADPLFSWHANLITINRRKAVVLVNDKNLYSVVLYGLKAKDFNQFNEIVTQGIREILQYEGIKDEIIEKYLSHSLDYRIARTKDRTSVARMNKMCENVIFFEGFLTSKSIFNSKISVHINKLLAGNGKNNYIFPNEEFHKDLEKFAGEPIFSINAVQLRIELELEDKKAWRRVIVPLNRTFEDLHEILQIIFSWKDYHLYEFYIYEELSLPSNVNMHPSFLNEDQFKPIVNLVCNESGFDSDQDIEKFLTADRKLSDYLPAYKKLTYIYDFGDDWRHEIIVEKVIENVDQPYPICIEGEENSPPEDVGGIIGYSEFLDIVANPNHPDHQNMVKWGQSQGYENFKINWVNGQLKRI